MQCKLQSPHPITPPKPVDSYTALTYDKWGDLIYSLESL